MEDKIFHKEVSISKPLVVFADIHGNFDKVKKILTQIPEDCHLCSVGDTIDRGIQNREVMDFIIDNNIDSVKGNHESEMEKEMVKVLDGTSVLEDSLWLSNGGLVTLAEFLNDNNEIVPQEYEKYRLWLENLPMYIKYKIEGDDNNVFVSHSGMNALLRDGEFLIPEKLNIDFIERGEIFVMDSNPVAVNNYIMWNRMHMVENLVDIGDAVNIFGHTPRIENFILDDKNICIDNGSYSKKEGKGDLIAIEYPSMKIYRA